MERGFNAGQTHSSIDVYIYLKPFMSYSEILVGNCNFFPTPLAFNALTGVFPLEFREKFGPQKTRIMGLPGSEDSLTGCAASTDVQPISITCAVVKKWYMN